MIVPPTGGGEQFFAATFRDQPDGSVLLRDPMSGEIMSPLRVPDVLRNWPVLKEGFDFLERYGDRIDFTLLPSIHDNGQDLVSAGVDLRAEANLINEKQGILFLEGMHDIGHAALLSNMFENMSQGTLPAGHYRDGLIALDDIFLADILDVIYATGARIENPDVRHNEDVKQMDLLGPVHSTLDQWHAFTLRARTFGPTPQNSKDLLVAETGFNNYREWAILGIIGAKLSRFENRHPVNSPIVGTLLMGSGHAYMAAKMQSLIGRPVRVVGERSMPVYDRYAGHVMRGIGAAVLSAATIKDFQAFRAGVTGSSYFS